MQVDSGGSPTLLSYTACGIIIFIYSEVTLKRTNYQDHALNGTKHVPVIYLTRVLYLEYLRTLTNQQQRDKTPN